MRDGGDAADDRQITWPLGFLVPGYRRDWHTGCPDGWSDRWSAARPGSSALAGLQARHHGGTAGICLQPVHEMEIFHAIITYR
jgi:hypothetical protein